MYVTKIWSKYSKHCRQERISFMHLWYVTTSCLLKLYLLSFSLPLRALRVLISKMSSGKRQFFCYIFPAFLAFLHGTMMNCQSLIDCKAWPWHFLLSWVCSSVLSRQAHAQWGRHYIFLADGQRQASSRNQFLSVWVYPSWDMSCLGVVCLTSEKYIYFQRIYPGSLVLKTAKVTFIHIKHNSYCIFPINIWPAHFSEFKL